MWQRCALMLDGEQWKQRFSDYSCANYMSINIEHIHGKHEFFVCFSKKHISFRTHFAIYIGQILPCILYIMCILFEESDLNLHECILEKKVSVSNLTVKFNHFLDFSTQQICNGLTISCESLMNFLYYAYSFESVTCCCVEIACHLVLFHNNCWIYDAWKKTYKKCIN